MPTIHSLVLGSGVLDTVIIVLKCPGTTMGIEARMEKHTVLGFTRRTHGTIAGTNGTRNAVL